MTLPNYPSPEVKEFGERVSEAMIDAQIQFSLGGGIGGCREYAPSNFAPDVRPYVEESVKGNLDSAAIMYAAMRTKEIELSAPP